MHLKDFMDLKTIQYIQDKFSISTGLAAIAVDAQGEYITEGSGFTDFCMKYTRQSQEGNKRCIKCDVEGKGTYNCHAGLMDFSVDIIVEGEKLGAIIGGQVLPNQPNLEYFKKIAKEINVNEEEYIEAVKKVPIRSEKAIYASAELLGEVINQMVNLEYLKYKNNKKLNELDGEIKKALDTVQQIEDKTKDLESIASKQNILTLNASIEAARSGESGLGFAVVAKEMGILAKQSSVLYKDIQKSSSDISKCIQKMAQSDRR